MCDGSRRAIIGAAGSLMAALALGGGAKAQPDPAGKRKVYTCPPCGCPNDGKEFDAPGPCSVCEMPLMEKPAAPEKKPPEAGPPAGAASGAGGPAAPDVATRPRS